MNTQRGFRSLSNNRNFGNIADQPAQQNLGYNQREEEPVVGWLNMMVEGRSGERRKLGKGIPLRESNALERAILDMLFDENGQRNDTDANVLFNALHIDVRANGNNGEDFDIALDVSDLIAQPVAEVEAVAKPTRKRVTTKVDTEA